MVQAVVEVASNGLHYAPPLRRHPFPCPMHPAAPLVAPTYTTQSTNVTFQLLTDLSDARTAELSCLQRGGHLATYASQAEQTEVEQYYIKAGYIIPTFHQFYWLSLSSNYMDYPDFSWWGANGAAVPVGS